MPGLVMRGLGAGGPLVLRGLTGSSGPVVTPYTPAPATPYRDNDAYFLRTPSIKGLLEDTREFDEVFFARSAAKAPITAQQGRVAVISPRDFAERNEGSERRKFRTVFYDLTIQFSEEDAQAAEVEADRLEAVARNALLVDEEGDPISYGGFTAPWTSQLGRGTLDDSRRPAYRITMRGQFGYGYDSATGLRTTSD
jgi:hypothetical protein